jgi:hypothetical protein
MEMRDATQGIKDQVASCQLVLVQGCTLPPHQGMYVEIVGADIGKISQNTGTMQHRRGRGLRVGLSESVVLAQLSKLISSFTFLQPSLGRRTFRYQSADDADRVLSAVRGLPSSHVKSRFVSLCHCMTRGHFLEAVY